MKTVLVTGATGGIGSLVCQRLAARGDRIILVSRSKEKIETLSSELSKKHDRNFPGYVLDFANSETVSKFAQNVREQTTVLDGLVLIYPSITKSPEVLPPISVWKEAFEKCFFQPLEIVRISLGLMGSGARIVIVSGIANSQVFPQLSMSNAIRSAWLAEAKTLAFNYGKTGIHVNTVSLGGTLTEKFLERLEQAQAGLAGAIYEDVPENIPLGRYGAPEDAAHVIETMLSDFSNHMTGANITCDGGLLRKY